MKTKSILFSLVVAATLVSNCGNKKEETATAEDHDHASGSSATAEVAAPQFSVHPSFQQQLSAVFTSYVALKDAFVSSDAGKVKEEAAKTQTALAGTDMKLLTGTAHHDWMTYFGGIESSLKEIQVTNDLEAQRKSFSTLSDNLYKSIKAYGLGGATAFYEYCPMAFNNEGGYWLSDQEIIRNPYFGNKMLTCGEVKEKLN